MKKSTLLLSFALLPLVVLLASCSQEKSRKCEEVQASVPVKEVQFTARDGVQVFADLYTQSATAPILLMFHQAGANGRGEYGPIIPRLLEHGYNLLVVDQRTGGENFGCTNRTAKQFGQEVSYCEAYPDVEAALDFVLGRGFSGPTVAWGSSYSAALAVKLAHDHPHDVEAVLAFSPATGEAMGSCQPNPLFVNLQPKLLVLRPAKEAEIPSVQEQLAFAKENGHPTYVAENGVHGSSMLVAERTESVVEPTWEVVERFLKSVER